MSEMMVDLPEPEEPTRAVTVPGCDVEGDAVEDGLAGLVGEGDVIEGELRRGWCRASMVRLGSAIFVALVEDLHGAVEAGDGFGELGADR